MSKVLRNGHLRHVHEGLDPWWRATAAVLTVAAGSEFPRRKAWMITDWRRENGVDFDACWRGLPGGRTDGDEKLVEITMKA